MHRKKVRMLLGVLESAKGMLTRESYDRKVPVTPILHSSQSKSW